MLHVGKKPARPPQDQCLVERIIRLRMDLQVAVEAEAYSTAAQLRDTIRKLESNTEVDRR